MDTLDANIFIRDASPSDPEHDICHALVARLYQRSTLIVVPQLVLVEVAGALSRRFRDPIRARLAIDLLRDLPTALKGQAWSRLAALISGCSCAPGLAAADLASACYS